MEHDFEVTISIVNGDFNIRATGDILDILQGEILAIAAIMATVRKDDVSDEELETTFLEEYRRATEFVKREGVDFKVNAK